MREIGCVVSLKGSAAVVAMPVSGACEKCGACMLSGDGREVLLVARNSAGASEGDTVEIEISSGRVVAAAFIIYMIPVFMTIVGFLVGNAISGGADDASLPIVLSVVFLVLSFLGVWGYDRRLRRSERRDAVVARVLSRQEVEEHQRQEHPADFGG